MNEFSDIQNRLNTVRESVDSLIQENRKLKSIIKHYDRHKKIRDKEKEIQSIKMRSIKILTQKEYELDAEFRERHYQSCNNGGHYAYDIQGTGIGVMVKVKCPICGEEKDITDITDW